MELPRLSSDDVRTIIPDVQDVADHPLRGGQKLVFPCSIGNERIVLKFMLASASSVGPPFDETDTVSLDAVTARARREVAILGQCDSPHIVRLGPVPFTHVDHEGQDLIYFSEEEICGEDLTTLLDGGARLATTEVIRLGIDITRAIKCLTGLGKVHRDIKPGNIMNRASSGGYVLLDMGLAFDPTELRVTASGGNPGTRLYFSPEQIVFDQTRQLDFRSDIFALGTVLYQASTGRHPFLLSNPHSDHEFFQSISTFDPPLISTFSTDFPSDLETVIRRMIAKRPHLRYRNCQTLVAALAQVSA